MYSVISKPSRNTNTGPQKCVFEMLSPGFPKQGNPRKMSKIPLAQSSLLPLLSSGVFYIFYTKELDTENRFHASIDKKTQSSFKKW